MAVKTAAAGLGRRQPQQVLRRPPWVTVTTTTAVFLLTLLSTTTTTPALHYGGSIRRRKANLTPSSRQRPPPTPILQTSNGNDHYNSKKQPLFDSSESSRPITSRRQPHLPQPVDTRHHPFWTAAATMCIMLLATASFLPLASSATETQLSSQQQQSKMSCPASYSSMSLGIQNVKERGVSDDDTTVATKTRIPSATTSSSCRSRYNAAIDDTNNVVRVIIYLPTTTSSGNNIDILENDKSNNVMSLSVSTPDAALQSKTDYAYGMELGQSSSTSMVLATAQLPLTDVDAFPIQVAMVVGADEDENVISNKNNSADLVLTASIHGGDAKDDDDTDDSNVLFGQGTARMLLLPSGGAGIEEDGDNYFILTSQRAAATIRLGRIDRPDRLYTW